MNNKLECQPNLPELHGTYLHSRQRHTKALAVFGEAADGRCVCTGEAGNKR